MYITSALDNASPPSEEPADALVRISAIGLYNYKILFYCEACLCARINTILCKLHLCLGTPLPSFIAHTTLRNVCFPSTTLYCNIAIYAIQYCEWQYCVNANSPPSLVLSLSS